MSKPVSKASTPVNPMRQMFLSAESVYGLVLVAGMIVVSRSLTATSVDALLTVLTTLLVFFSAHVYAGMIPHLGGRGLVRHGSHRAEPLGAHRRCAPHGSLRRYPHRAQGIRPPLSRPSSCERHCPSGSIMIGRRMGRR